MFWYATYPDLNLLRCARVAPGSCPGDGLGVQSVGAFVYFGHMSSFFVLFLFQVAEDTFSKPDSNSLLLYKDPSVSPCSAV